MHLLSLLEKHKALQLSVFGFLPLFRGSTGTLELQNIINDLESFLSWLFEVVSLSLSEILIWQVNKVWHHHFPKRKGFQIRQAVISRGVVLLETIPTCTGDVISPVKIMRR